MSTTPIPIFIKISPDLEVSQLEEIVMITDKYRLAGIIATNTSIDYQLLQNPKDFSKGGISGAPLLHKSTKILAQLSVISEGKIQLIGVGGVSSGAEAFTKICAGASAIQLYTALVYEGFSVINKICIGVDKLLKADGHQKIRSAIGSKREKWL